MAIKLKNTMRLASHIDYIKKTFNSGRLDDFIIQYSKEHNLTDSMVSRLQKYFMCKV